MVTLDRVMEREIEEDIIPKFEQETKLESEHHNGRVVIIDGLAYKISCPRFKQCKGPTYNNGYIKHLCSFGNEKYCPTENPDVCKHENFASIGHTAKKYKEYSKRQ